MTAVKRMYEEQPDNLFLVDLICHGVPSNKWLVDYIANTLKIKADKVSSIGFRLFEAFSLCVYNDDRLIYKSGNLWTHRYEDLYYNTFIDGFTYRDSCFNCHYAKPERVSDITIGDFGDWVMKLTIIIFPNIRMAFPVFFLLQKKVKDSFRL